MTSSTPQVTRNRRKRGSFVGVLRGWWAGDPAMRDHLPWRRTNDPWCVLVAETMLMQTQADRVVAHYLAFIDRFPDVQSCADAPISDVIQHWVGLGYNRRALLLHRAAEEIIERHNGRVPQSLEALLALSGVGPYTARAVLAFAFNESVGAVDTNIGRVLARAVAGRPLRQREAQDLANDLVPTDEGRTWNLAVMDFGNLVCTAKAPRCASCPVGQARRCAWRTHGDLADPASGSAGVTKRQSTFAGSDRQGRGRLVKAACDGPIKKSDIAAAAGWPKDGERAFRVAGTLVADGLLVADSSGTLRLR